MCRYFFGVLGGVMAGVGGYLRKMGLENENIESGLLRDNCNCKRKPLAYILLLRFTL